MQDWKKRLYDAYVSTGQAAGGGTHAHRFSAGQFPQYARLLARLGQTPKDASIADLACGNGGLVFFLQDSGFTDVVGVDISQEQVDLAAARGAKNVSRGEIDAFLGDRSSELDLIFFMDVLEHLERQELFDTVGRATAALRPGGRLVIHVPNATGIFGSRIRYGDLTHEQAFTAKSVRQLLSVFGYESVEVYEESPIPHGLKSTVRACIYWTVRLNFWLMLVAETGTTRHVLSQNMLVVARKPA